MSTVPGNAALDPYVGLLALDGTLVALSAPERPLAVSAAVLLANRRSIASSRSGGLPETQALLGW